MIEHFYPPWPESALCPACQRPVTVSFYDEPARQSVFRHEDNAVLPCRLDGGSPYRRRPDNTITFPVQMGAEFLELADAIVWGRRLVEGGKETEVYLGYIHAHDGHRKIGALRSQNGALAAVQKKGEETVVLQ